MSDVLTSPTACAHCSDDLEHCHETLVIHDDGHAECADAECAAHWETHDFRLFCDERHETCLQCRPAPTVEPPRRVFTRRRLAVAA